MAKKSDTQFELRLGALTDNLTTQLRKQKVRFDLETVKRFELDLQRIIALSIHGLLSSKEKSNAFARLVKKLEQHVQQYN
jgi:hypothetical protein